jgi:hypothetical protein
MERGLAVTYKAFSGFNFENQPCGALMLAQQVSTDSAGRAPQTIRSEAGLRQTLKPSEIGLERHSASIIRICNRSHIHNFTDVVQATIKGGDLKRALLRPWLDG